MVDEVTGEIIIDYVDSDGNEYPRLEMQDVYSVATPFFGNISMSGGEAEAVEFGLNLADYEAVLVMGKNSIPISEGSLIWLDTEPIVKANGYVDQYSADYKVIKVSPSLNVDKYVLKKVVK
jgi:hypothetical protein